MRTPAWLQLILIGAVSLCLGAPAPEQPAPPSYKPEPPPPGKFKVCFIPGLCDNTITEVDIDIDVEIPQNLVILRSYCYCKSITNGIVTDIDIAKLPRLLCWYWYWNYKAGKTIIVIDIDIASSGNPLLVLILSSSFHYRPASPVSFKSQVSFALHFIPFTIRRAIGHSKRGNFLLIFQSFF